MTDNNNKTPVRVRIDNDSGAEYDTMAANSFPQESTDGLDGLTMVTKADATAKGRPAVGIHFNAVVWSPDTPDNKTTVPVFSEMTSNQLLTAVAMIVAGHPELADEFQAMFNFQIPDIPDEMVVEGLHDGTPYSAIAFSGYVVKVAGSEAHALASEKAAILPVVKQMLAAQ